MYIRGVTVHKIHGSVWYDTVVSWFSMFSIWGGQLVMLQCWKYFCFKPWGRVNWLSHKQAFAPGFAQCKLSARFMLVNILISNFTISRVMTKLSASDAAYSLRDNERRIYFNICWERYSLLLFSFISFNFSCGPYILKKREEMYLVKSRYLK